MNNSLASLVCHLCLKTFSTKGNLKMHYMVHTGEKPYTCEVCKKGFTQKGNLKAHLQRHMDSRQQLDNDFCNEIFSREGPTLVQFKPEPNDRIYKCQECFKNFNTEVSLCGHILSNHVTCAIKQDNMNSSNNNTNGDNTNYKCNICKERVSSFSELEMHLFVHKTLKPYTSYQNNGIHSVNPMLEIGNKDYLARTASESSDDEDDENDTTSTSNEASTFVSIPYAEIKPFACQICGKRYFNELSLKIHYKTHMHPYICKICQKTFPHRCNLELHELAHARYKPYVCQVCDKSFAQKSQYENHHRKHTGTWKPFTCNICNKSYTSKYYLRTHLERHKLGLIPMEVREEQARIPINLPDIPTQ